ncbi:MAG: hypothetical protein QHJ82_08740 [Verrucomicrobiota bacterium]|nr:hypothetical protein [Verrucomicrobiota bacterium]
MDNFFISAAYKYVAILAMLGEANFFADKANLPLDHPITQQDIRPGSHISPPRLMGFGGSIVTDSYFFGFGQGGLANFRKRHFDLDSERAIREQNLRFAEMKSLISTNEAYQLATNWLVAIDVDIEALEKRHPPKVTQRLFYPDAKGFNDAPELRKQVLTLPIFDIQWGDIPMRSGNTPDSIPALSVTIFGPTKELLAFHLIDRSLSLRPDLINDRESLLAISDDEFRKYDSQQRSNLVSRFSGLPEPKRDARSLPATHSQTLNLPVRVK